MEPRPEDDPPIESPPEGSTCSEHSERQALVICPRCGSFACLSCWHGAVRRCHACVVRLPAPPVPWEDGSRGVFSRFFGTLMDAGSPVVSAPSFRHPGVGRAAAYFLLTFVPLAVLSGVVPYTVHLLFGPSFSLELRPPDVSDGAIAMDVARAMGVGLGIALALWVALTVPFVSLSNAYAERGHPDAPLRAMLYRGWLLAFFLLLYTVAPLGLPAQPSEVAETMLGLLSIVPLLLLLTTMRATTRMGSGVGALAALVAVGVPLLLMLFARELLHRGVPVVVPGLAQYEESQAPAARTSTDRP